MDASSRRLQIPASAEEGAGRRSAKRGEAGVGLTGRWGAGVGRYDEVRVRAAAGVVRGGGGAGLAAVGGGRRGRRRLWSTGGIGELRGPLRSRNCASRHSIRWLFFLKKNNWVALVDPCFVFF